MLRLKFNSHQLLPLFLTVVSLNANNVLAETYSHDDNPLTIQIKTEKTVFEIGEAVEGTVILDNRYPASVLAVFNIRLFHDGKFVAQETTSIPQIPMGTMEFSFKHFGIPQFNDHPGTEGAWQITVVQQNRDVSYAAEVTIQIVPSQKKEFRINSDEKRNPS